MKNLANEQMELSLSGAPQSARRREDRMSRAAWWFNKMRAVVNGAMAWEAAGQPRPEQTWLPGTQRHVRI